jgi:AcrR family transcriptional regulator
MPPAATTHRRAAPLPPAERRRAVIEAVLPLLIEQGAAVTTRQIANAAGVSEGTIFNVFADKDELIAAAVEAAIDQAPFERAVTAIDRSVPFDQQLIAATELIQRRIVDIWRLVSSLGPPHGGHDRHPLPDSASLAALFAATPGRVDATPADAARLLRAITLSLTHPMLAAEPRSASDIVDVFLHGVGVRS